MSKAVDVEKIKRAARNSIPISIKTFTLPHETEEYMERILEIFLSEFGQDQLSSRIGYCMRELAVNAKKANTKRIYFKEKSLDINDPRQYEEGMERFKQETLDNIDYYLNKQKDAGLYVKVVYHAKGNAFTMSIHNNSRISRKEQIRVYDRIARSRAFDSMEEALSSVMDDSEGAGLGIVILVLMLKKMGLDEDAFDIDVDGDETIARITVPFSAVHLENINELSREIVNEINELPQFPDNIVYLQKLISDPDSEISDIARQISTDPSLTADLLKHVNSAQFMLPKRVDNIVEAVKLVGFRGIKNLLYSFGTLKILDSNQRWLWDHSYRTAFYAYNLAKNFKRRKELLDDAYVGGILHDMGKIIFSNVHPNLLEKIQGFCTDRNIHRDFIEDLSAGLNHAEIGALIAEKWNFPVSLIEAIRYHHDPLAAHNEFRDVVYTVYLANALCGYERGDIEYDQLETEVIRDFGITSQDKLDMVQQRLSLAFDDERNKKM
ncbi:HDOD domain-containing protein [Marispirochaeta aestuarii]|uniref:HDOD domain-containing protein n=1 Tax=Marispirochaeta aestuarii TaxID=1963862 RepID=UPI0029C87FF5|nr:HDOD domain-containing protein [Marispirochaeta aestuarii]